MPTMPTMDEMTTVDERRAIRRLAGRGQEYAVCVIAGRAAPTPRGHSWRYLTAGGALIEYPVAYARTGWSNMRYDYSTLRVEVGSAWLAAWRAAGGEEDPAAVQVATISCARRLSVAAAWRRWDRLAARQAV